MPSNEEHAQHTYRLYGVWAHDLHRWMDAPSRNQWNHRRFRHNPRRPPPLSAVKKYGYDMARKIQIAHLELDGVFWDEAPELPIWQEGDWIYKRMPSGKVYKRQLSGIPKSSPTKRIRPSAFPYCEHCGERIIKVFPTGQVLCKCGQYRPSKPPPRKYITKQPVTIEVRIS